MHMEKPSCPSCREPATHMQVRRGTRDYYFIWYCIPCSIHFIEDRGFFRILKDPESLPEIKQEELQ
jgi:ribosomal protein L37AE/L43A